MCRAGRDVPGDDPDGGRALQVRGDEALVDDVEHLEERHLVVDALGLDRVERPGGVRSGLAPDLEGEVEFLAHL